jgi:hypothetical protein
LFHPQVSQGRNQAFSLADSGFLGNTLLIDAGTGQNKVITDSFS